MHPHNTTHTVAFPATSTNFLPFVDGSVSPINQVPTYHVDGKVRTIYVTSNDNLGQWDAHSRNAIYALADGPNFEHEQEDLAKQAIHRTRSNEFRVVSSPRMKAVHSHQRGGNSGSSMPKLPATVFLDIRQHGPLPLPTTRQCILFYHKNDPYYGFTNFSLHPVTYKCKEYPTSEHLFQSFKVIF